MNVPFEKRKADCLGKDDKSSIGSWDKPILKLCQKINSKKNLYTLSSCSGRIVLLKNLDKKQPGMFILRTHEKITFNELKKAFNEYDGKESLMFKQEAGILHICCKEVNDAEEILKKARLAGWKNSGIMSLVGRIVLELRSTEYISLPIYDKELLVDDKFLKILVKEANKKLEKAWEKINNLEKVI
jgi:tRNA wybutosine-synthesizing protein 3